jgi:hypothetical protein
VYKRKDHLDRHTKQKGHIASSQSALSLPTSPINPTMSTRTIDRRSRVGISLPDNRTSSPSHRFGTQILVRNEQAMPLQDPSRLQVLPVSSRTLFTKSTDDTFTISDADLQPFSLLDPSLLQIPLISSTSFYTAGSMDDTLTVSDIDSFWSEPI